MTRGPVAWGLALPPGGSPRPQSATLLLRIPGTRQAITGHLYALDSAGLVRHARKGREQIWDLNAKRLEIARQYLDYVAAQWDAAAARLKAFVEHPEETADS